MTIKPSSPRSPRSAKILWKWTAVSAALHVLFIALICTFSYITWQHKQAATAAKVALEEAAAVKAEAERAAKAAAAPSAAPSAAPASEPPPVQAEKVLGIDKVAKPDEIPQSPFASGESDLLKDLK